MRRALRRTLWAWGALLFGLAAAYRPVFQGRLIAGRDAFRLYFPDSSFLLECLRSGALPLWIPYTRLGQPFAAGPAAQAFYPLRVLPVLLAGPYWGLTLQQVLHAALAAVGTYLLCRRLRASRPAAALGGAAFGLSPLLTDLATQFNVVSSATWSGFLILCALDAAKRPGAARVAAVAVFGALSFLAGSPETLLWQGLLAVAVAVAVCRVRGGLTVAGGLLGSLGLAAIAALPAVEFALHSTRGSGRDDQLDWSTSLPQLMAMAWPRADLPRGDYWSGDQWFVVTVFLGTLACALALASLRRSARVVPFAALGLALAVLSLGAHFPPSAWVLRLPPFVFFRYPAKYLVGVAFCAAVLCALGVDRATALARRVRPSLPRAGAVVAGAVLALLALAPVTRAPVFRKGVQQGLPWVVLCLGAALLLVFCVPAGPRRGARLRWGLALLAGAELLAFHLLQVGFGWEAPRRLLQPSRMAAALPRPLEGRISLPVTDKLAEEDDFIDTSRDALVPNRSVEERLHALEGYGAPEPLRTDEFLMAGQRSIFDLAGVRYYVRGGRKPYPDLETLPTGPGLPALYRSSTAFPRAFVVQRAQVVPDTVALEKVRYLSEPTRATAFLASGEPLEAPACEGSRAEVVREDANALDLAVNACGEGYLVLTDADYPGWKAEVDGAPTPVLRADYALRAVRVGPGRHRVAFRYWPQSFAVGAALSALSLALVVLAFFRRSAR